MLCKMEPLTFDIKLNLFPLSGVKGGKFLSSSAPLNKLDLITGLLVNLPSIILFMNDSTVLRPFYELFTSFLSLVMFDVTRYLVSHL
jgi:hypothetical protein